MGKPHEASGLLTVFGAVPTRATLTLITQSPGERLVRALGVLAACWGAALVAVFIPVAHFLLVPGLAIGGLAWAVVRFRECQRLRRIHGPCPRCGRAQDFVPAGSRRHQLVVDCPGCFTRLLVSLEEPPPFGPSPTCRRGRRPPGTRAEK